MKLILVLGMLMMVGCSSSPKRALVHRFDCKEAENPDYAKCPVIMMVE
jgi:uncharacterized protein YcfL